MTRSHLEQNIRINYRGDLPHLLVAHQVHSQTLSVHLPLYNDLIRRDEREKALAELNDTLSLFPHCAQSPRLRKMRAALEIALSRSRN